MAIPNNPSLNEEWTNDATGVTYRWDGERWFVVQAPSSSGESKTYRLESEEFGQPQIQLIDQDDNYTGVHMKATGDITVSGTANDITYDVDLSPYATLTYSDSEDQDLQNQIDELSVTKGKVARYTCSSITGGFASRPGQLAFNSGDPTAVNQISFGTEDSDNVVTKPMADGDIIEFVDAVSSTVSRFKITDASGAPTGVEVEYVSGNNDFNVGEEEQVYVYPQNEAGASKDYVDAQDDLKLDKAGGTMTGALAGVAFKGLKASGPVLTIGTSSDNIKAIIHANGNLDARKANFEGEILLNGGDDTDNLSIYPNVGNDDSAITALNGGALRFRTSPSNRDDANKRTHIAFDKDATGKAITYIYHLGDPISDQDAATKKYIDEQIAQLKADNGLT